MPAVSARRPGAAREWDLLLVVALGGAAGSAARWALTVVWSPAPGAFPVGTWVANTTGAFAIGVLLVGVSARRRPSRYLRPFLGVGVLGGYTTWSTAMLDVHAALLTGQPAHAAAYLLATLAAGLAAAWAGVATARWVVRRGLHPGSNDADRPPP